MNRRWCRKCADIESQLKRIIWCKCYLRLGVLSKICGGLTSFWIFCVPKILSIVKAL